MVNRDEEIEEAQKRPPTGKRVSSEPPDSDDFVERVRRVRPPTRPQTRYGPPLQAQASRPSSFKVPDVTVRGPSRPAWENPPSLQNFPQLRGRENRRTMWPLLLAFIGVALVLGVLVVYPAVTGRGGTEPSATASATPTATASPSSQPSPSAVASASASATIRPTLAPGATYPLYKVQPGDNLTKIAAKFKVTPAEILAANPQIIDRNNIKVGTYINIPVVEASSPTPVAP